MIKAHNPNNLPTIDYRDLIELQPNSFKDLSEKNFDKLSNSFKVHGFITPYFVWKDKDKHFILDGHQRSRVLSNLEPNGLEVPYILIEAKSKQEAAKKLLAIDSRYGKRTAEGEQEFLDIFEIEQGYIEDVAVLEFEFEAEDTETAAEEDDFDVPQGGFKTDIVLGDLFEIGEHRLLCGDSTDSDQVAKLMNGEKADIMVTDPPYNVAYEGKTKDAMTIQNDKMSNSDFKSFLDSFFSCSLIELKEGAPIYVFCPIEDGAFLNAFLNSGFKLQSILIWLKNTIVMGRKDYNYKHEPILYGWKEGAAHKWYGSFDKSTIIECNKPPRNGEHPTMKPIELLEIVLNNSSQSNDLVLDLFLGSGTTMVASHQLKRKCYGMELDSKYAEVIVRRMIKLDNTLTIKRNGIDETEKWLSKINEASDEEE